MSDWKHYQGPFGLEEEPPVEQYPNDFQEDYDGKNEYGQGESSRTFRGM